MPARFARLLRLSLGLALLTASLGAIAQGVEKPSIKAMMDWTIQGTHAPFIVADAKGYFKDEGLTVQIDRGTGAGNTVTAVAGGAARSG